MEQIAPEQWVASASSEAQRATAPQEIERLRVQWLGRKGTVTLALRGLGQVAPEQRRSLGQQINQAKQQIEVLLEERADQLKRDALEAKLRSETIDITMPGRHVRPGAVHPIRATLERVVQIFEGLGYAVAEGPEIETDYYNFEALNFPPDHPARAMHDTFYFPDGRLLRTHTSPVQIRAMEKTQPPIRVIAPGKVYRSDSDQTHTPMFHQVEGLLVADDVNFADLKGTLESFVEAFFDRSSRLRFRASYFPFTEPSAEVDIEWHRPEGADWLEILGCGMVHPHVLEAGGIDPERYTGFAFGMGIERLAMLRHGVRDLRMFFENDLEFLEQFRAA